MIMAGLCAPADAHVSSNDVKFHRSRVSLESIFTAVTEGGRLSVLAESCMRSVCQRRDEAFRLAAQGLKSAAQVVGFVAVALKPDLGSGPLEP